MKWQIEIQGRDNLLVDLPSSLNRDSWVPVTIGARLYHLQWNSTLDSYHLRDEDGLEQNIKVRSRSITQFPGEAQRSLMIELTGQGSHLIDRIETVASPHVPGSAFRKRADASDGATIRSPMVGKIIKVLVQDGQQVTKGQELLVIEAMKMENKIIAPIDGLVSALKAAEGEQTGVGDKLLIISQEDT